MTSAVKLAVKSGQIISPEEITTLAEDLKSTSIQADQGALLLNNLLGLEKASKSKIEQALTILKQKQKKLQKYVSLGAHYRLLSMEPLKWRDAKGWPKLAVFSLKSPFFELKISGHYVQEKSEWKPQTKFSPNLPEAICICYKDTEKKLRNIWQADEREDLSVKLRCRFEGLVPESVKQKIDEAHNQFEEIFIIAEPTGWELNKTARVIPKHDPLVVGFDGNNLWLIANFDTTPVEQAMMFSKSQK